MNEEKPKLDLDELAAADSSDEDDIELSEDENREGGQSDTEDDVPALSAEHLGAIYDVPVQISAVLGRTSMSIDQLLRLGRGAILELDRNVGEAIDVVVNNRLVAKGEVVIIDEKIGITMTEIIKGEG